MSANITFLTFTFNNFLHKYYFKIVAVFVLIKVFNVQPTVKCMSNCLCLKLVWLMNKNKPQKNIFCVFWKKFGTVVNLAEESNKKKWASSLRHRPYHKHVLAKV